MNEILITIVLSIGLLCSMGPKEQDKNDVAGKIIAMEKAALDRWGKGDPSGFLEICAPEVTYFDPSLERRKDGLEAMRAYYEQLRGKVSIDRYDMINPLVQVHGEIAVLSFNLEDWSTSDGMQKEYRWNSTEVYKRFNEGWRIIHTHWSFTQPELN